MSVFSKEKTETKSKMIKNESNFNRKHFLCLKRWKHRKYLEFWSLHSTEPRKEFQFGIYLWQQGLIWKCPRIKLHLELKVCLLLLIWFLIRSLFQKAFHLALMWAKRVMMTDFPNILFGSLSDDLTWMSLGKWQGKNTLLPLFSWLCEKFRNWKCSIWAKGR